MTENTHRSLLVALCSNICPMFLSSKTISLNSFSSERVEIIAAYLKGFLKKNGIFLFGISFFVLEIFAFLYYANEESDDVIDRSTKTIKYWIKNISRNIGAVIFKLAPELYITKETKWPLLYCCHGNTLGSSLFLCKTKYPRLQPFWVRQGVFLGTDMVPTLS